jgi:protein O-mannosyl-transferase
MKKGSAQPTAAGSLTRRYSLYLYIAVCFLCIGASFLLYANSLHNEFVFDDLPLIVDNVLIQDIGNLGKVIGWESGEPLYRPVRYVSYMLDYWLWGLKPAGYHAANILYHALSSFILYLVLLELLGNGGAAVAGAVLYLSHPVLTDSVTYISGRRDVLVGLFYLLSFYYFVRYRKEPHTGYAVLTGIFFLLALGSKEMGITLPGICLVYDFMHAFAQHKAKQPTLSRMKQAAAETVQRGWKIYLPLALMGGIYFYYKIVLYYASSESSYYGGSAASNFATVVRIICHYIKLVFFPVVLHADYSYNAFPLSQSFLEWRVLGAGLAVAGLLWVTLRALKRLEWVFFGGMWFFITLLPVSQIFPHHELMAEHYLYLPLAGMVIMAGPLLVYVMEKKQRVAQGLLLMIALLYGLRTIERNSDWRDGMALWNGVVAAAPESARGHDNLGTEYFRRKDYKTALHHYQEAARLRPGDGMFHNNLGMAYGALGDLDNAEKALLKALKHNFNLAKTHNNLGKIYYFKGDYEKASEYFSNSIRLDSGILDDRGSLAAMVCFCNAKVFMALDEKQFAARFAVRPDLVELGRDKVAIMKLKRAIVLKPNYVKAYEALAGLYRKTGDTDQALQAQRTLDNLKNRTNH